MWTHTHTHTLTAGTYTKLVEQLQQARGDPYPPFNLSRLGGFLQHAGFPALPIRGWASLEPLPGEQIGYLDEEADFQDEESSLTELTTNT